MPASMLSPRSPRSHEHGKKLMQFFGSRQDKSLLMIMDSQSRSGHIFKVMAEETWTLIWSGIVTQEFLDSPAWKWEETVHDPDKFPGGWPKQNSEN